MTNQYTYFTYNELSCHGVDCCGNQQFMNEEFMQKIIVLRRELDFPFEISSAYRCPTHNQEVSTTGVSGPHTTGRAIDILCHTIKAFHLLESAILSGMFTGIGINQKGPLEKRFIHLDDIPERQRVWSY